MKYYLYQIKQLNRKFLLHFILLTVFSLSIQNQATANEDEIVAMANWASINFSDIFFDNYTEPLTGFGYCYVCFAPSNNCIGINQENGSVDVLINGEVSTVGTVESILDLISNSQNGILELSGESVENNTVPAIYSPGLGITGETGGIILSIDWRIQVIPEGNSDPNNQLESFDFRVTVNPTNPTTVLNIDFVGNVVAGSILHHWSNFFIITSTAGFAGITIDYDKRTLTFTEDVILPKIAGGTDVLNIASGSTLVF